MAGRSARHANQRVLTRPSPHGDGERSGGYERNLHREKHGRECRHDSGLVCARSVVWRQDRALDPIQCLPVGRWDQNPVGGACGDGLLDLIGHRAHDVGDVGGQPARSWVEPVGDDDFVVGFGESFEVLGDDEIERAASFDQSCVEPDDREFDPVVGSRVSDREVEAPRLMQINGDFSRTFR